MDGDPRQARLRQKHSQESEARSRHGRVSQLHVIEDAPPKSRSSYWGLCSHHNKEESMTSKPGNRSWDLKKKKWTVQGVPLMSVWHRPGVKPDQRDSWRHQERAEKGKGRSLDKWAGLTDLMGNLPGKFLGGARNWRSEQE